MDVNAQRTPVVKIKEREARILTSGIKSYRHS
jgi:hypothetical protein